MNNSQQIHKVGQSIWFDNIDRKLLENGWFKDQIKKGIFYGVTSNPSIFKNSITQGNEYTQDIQSLSWSGLSTQQIYEHLAIEDIKNVADLLLPIYKKSKGTDGYVSLEVDPSLAHDKEKTIQEAKRLWKLLEKKNLMIKVPATKAGIFAIRELTTAGININVTLIFSVDRYLEVIDAYFSGLEARISKGLAIDEVHSVASFFISRLDVKVEAKVADLISAKKMKDGNLDNYLGKIANLNALYAYGEFVNSINSKRFKAIADKGGNFQRPLWASTGTKNPVYSDVLYVDNLILPQTVNTVPPKTLDAFLDHGKSEIVDYSAGKKDFKSAQEALEKAGVRFEVVWLELENEGVQKFIDAQDDLLNAIDIKRIAFQESISELKEGVSDRIRGIKYDKLISRLFKSDDSLFTNNPSEVDEVLHRLGWIEAPKKSEELVSAAEVLLAELLQENFTSAVVLGMGGSSLAPEVFSRVFSGSTKNKEKGLKLSILDSTDPLQILSKLEEINLEKTLFIVSSKSGTTAEVKSLLAFFWNEFEKMGTKSPGDNFIAITDPGTLLEKIGKERNFRRVFNADPNVGGRYSALIAFGLIPAVLAGIDGNKFLASAQYMQKKCGQDTLVEVNPSVVLAAILAESYSKGRDKISVLSDDRYKAVGSWLEQLVAESSGKSGKGLLPIDGEPLIDAKEYSDDRVFYYLRTDGKHDVLVASLLANKQPIVVSQLRDEYDLPAEMYKWEMATTITCSLMHVNPFNQPNVQESKSITHQMIDAYKTNPILEVKNILFADKRLRISGNLGQSEKSDSIKVILDNFITPQKGDYIAINAFLPRLQEYDAALQTLRKQLLEKYSVPITLGYGPRFLHSTGQLHKGGKNNGLFLLLTQESSVDIDIPNEDMKFSVLLMAQALGDMQALEQNNRRILHIHFIEKAFIDFDLNSLFK